MSMDWLEPEMQASVAELSEPHIVTLVLYGEARSEPVQGIVAVGNVIRHRVNAKSWFGKDYKGVCTRSWQFSCLHPKGGAKNYARVLVLAQQLAAGKPPDDSKYAECAWVARGIIGGFLRDNVKGSTHYHTSVLQPRPEWARKLTPTVQVAGHVFYAGVP